MVAEPRIGQEWTVEQYLAMERSSTVRHEFVGGRVYAMSGGTQRHSSIGVTLAAALADRLYQRPDNRCQVFNSDMKVHLANERDYVYPDASVTCDERDLADPDADFIRYPCLVVEVLSASTEMYDRQAKFDLYRERGALRDYVLIETRHQAVEVRSRAADETWTTGAYGPGDAVVLPSLDLAIPIAALYRGVTF